MINNQIDLKYQKPETSLSYAENAKILAWWNDDCDSQIIKMISKWDWNWYWFITDEIKKCVNPMQINAWKEADPLCSQYAWYNIIMNFAMARAESTGLGDKISGPKIRKCKLCYKEYSEAELPIPIIVRFGVGRLLFCKECLGTHLYQNSGNSNLSKQDVKNYLKNIAETLKIIPSQGFGEGVDDIKLIPDEDLVQCINLLRTKPSVDCVKRHFGSWLEALIEAEILDNGTRKTSRGIQTLANDGHVCLSLGEKTIDDFLFLHNIRHEKEPPYPEGNYRGDFIVGGTIIEYFGLAGDPSYDSRIKIKKEILRRHNVCLIEIYPKDLADKSKLEKKLRNILNAY